MQLPAVGPSLFVAQDKHSVSNPPLQVTHLAWQLVQTNDGLLYYPNIKFIIIIFEDYFNYLIDIRTSLVLDLFEMMMNRMLNNYLLENHYKLNKLNGKENTQIHLNIDLL